VKLAAKKEAEEKTRRVGDPRITFGELSKRYQKLHVPTLAPKSQERIEEVLRLHLLPRFGERAVESLRAFDVETYRQERLGQKAKPATVNREVGVFSAILAKGRAWELIDREPIPRGAVQRLHESSERLVYFEPEEAAKLLSAFDNAEAWRRHVASVTNLGPVKIGRASPEERRYGGGRRPDSQATDAYLARLRATLPVLRTLLLTGCRVGEVISLRWEAVDLKRGVVTIFQHKTRRPKTVPVSEDLGAVLKALPAGVGAAFVFKRPDGSAWNVVDIQRAFAVAKKLSGIRPGLRLHDLRHTFASWLAIRGVPLRTIQELLGHADVRMTIRYAKLSPAHLRDAVSVIGSVLRERNGNETAETGNG
jgi:integrase